MIRQQSIQAVIESLGQTSAFLSSDSLHNAPADEDRQALPISFNEESVSLKFISLGGFCEGNSISVTFN